MSANFKTPVKNWGNKTAFYLLQIRNKKSKNT